MVERSWCRSANRAPRWNGCSSKPPRKRRRKIEMNAVSPGKNRYIAFSPSRVWTLATNTVTQLLRMKILWFLAVFGVIVLIAAFAWPTKSPDQQLKLLKDVVFGVLQV